MYSRRVCFYQLIRPNIIQGPYLIDLFGWAPYQGASVLPEDFLSYEVWIRAVISNVSFT